MKLAVLLVVVLVGGVLFVGAVSGWFDDTKVVLSEEYYGDFEEFNELSATEYEKLIEEQKSLVLLVDQGGCKTADKLRDFVSRWAEDAGIKVQKLMFSEMKETSLHDDVKYYPSVVVVSKGRVVAFLRADSDDDAAMYNDEEAFREWTRRYLK